MQTAFKLVDVKDLTKPLPLKELIHTFVKTIGNYSIVEGVLECNDSLLLWVDVKDLEISDRSTNVTEVGVFAHELVEQINAKVRSNPEVAALTINDFGLNKDILKEIDQHVKSAPDSTMKDLHLCYKLLLCVAAQRYIADYTKNNPSPINSGLKRGECVLFVSTTEADKFQSKQGEQNVE